MHDIGATRLEVGGTRSGAGYQNGHAATSPFNEMQELELASELMEVTSEEELEQFLGDLWSKVSGAARRFVRSDTGQALTGILKDAAKQALPVAGKAIGNWVSPGAGGDIGQNLATQAGNMLGLELEGLSNEDREFEVARQFVRFAGAASNAAAQSGAGGPEAARDAAVAAARNYAPGLLPVLRGRSGINWPRGGRWVRQGRTITLYS
jgi:hypothetical protein